MGFFDQPNAFAKNCSLQKASRRWVNRKPPTNGGTRGFGKSWYQWALCFGHQTNYWCDTWLRPQKTFACGSFCKLLAGRLADYQPILKASGHNMPPQHYLPPEPPTYVPSFLLHPEISTAGPGLQSHRSRCVQEAVFHLDTVQGADLVLLPLRTAGFLGRNGENLIVVL